MHDDVLARARRFLDEALEPMLKPEQRYKKMKTHAMATYRGSGLSKRERDRRVYGMLRKRGWKPHREREKGDS